MTQLIGGGTARSFEVAKEDTGGSRIKVRARFPIFGMRLAVVVYPKEHTGKILVPRWQDKPGGNHSLIWQLTDNIYSAVRQTLYVLAEYGPDLKSGEKKAMLAAESTARNLNLTVLGLDPQENVKRMRQAMRGAYSRFAQAIGTMPRKPLKKAALARMTAVQRSAEVIDRPNPNVTIENAQKAALLAFGRLHNEIFRIDPRIHARQKALANIIHLAELRLKTVDDLLVKLLARDGLRPAVTDFRRREVIAAQLSYYAEDLEAIDFAPYKNACARTAHDLREAARLLKAGRVNRENLLKIRRLLVNCRSAIAIKTEQIALEREIFRLTKLLKSGGCAKQALNSIRDRLNAITARLAHIDEKSLKQPVCERVIGQILSAAGSLSNLRNKETVRLKPKSSEALQVQYVRELLKSASAIL